MCWGEGIGNQWLFVGYIKFLVTTGLPTDNVNQQLNVSLVFTKEVRIGNIQLVICKAMRLDSSEGEYSNRRGDVWRHPWLDSWERP